MLPSSASVEISTIANVASLPVRQPSSASVSHAAASASVYGNGTSVQRAISGSWQAWTTSGRCVTGEPLEGDPSSASGGSGTKSVKDAY